MRAHSLGDIAHGRDNNFNLISTIAASDVILPHAWPLTQRPGTAVPLQTLLRGENPGRVGVFVFITPGLFITASFLRRSSLAGLYLRPNAAGLPGLVLMPLQGVDLAMGSQLPAWILDGTVMFFDAGDATVRQGIFGTNPYPAAFNGSLWTLKFELLCYAGVVIAGGLGLLSSHWLALGLPAAMMAGHYAIPHVTGRLVVQQLFYLGVPFACGMAAFIWRDRIALDLRILMILGGMTAAMWWTPAFYPALIAVIAYGLLRDGYAGPPFLRGCNRAGDCSYGIYIHAFFLRQLLAMRGVINPQAKPFPGLALTLPFAIFSWHLVEGPALRGRERLAAMLSRSPKGEPRS